MAIVFDLDGTLIDSVYQHVLAWREAMEAEGLELAAWRIHRRIGMSAGLMARAILRQIGSDPIRPGAQSLRYDQATALAQACAVLVDGAAEARRQVGRLWHRARSGVRPSRGAG